MNQVSKVLLLIFPVITASAVLAEETPAAETAPPPPSGFEFGAYFDGYYQVSPQAHAAMYAPPGGGSPVAVGGPRVVEGRYFERIANQFTLNYVELSARKKLGKIAFRLDTAFGEAVDVIASGGPTAGSMGNGDGAGNPAAQEPTHNITQATVSYAPIERLTLTFGKFYTAMGFETTKAKENLQYSRSFAFDYGIPLWHEGLAAAYQVIPAKLTGTVFLLDNLTGPLASSTSQSPAYGLAINSTPSEKLAVNYFYHGANEFAANTGRRDLHEFSGTFNFTPSYAISADFLYGSQRGYNGKDASWSSLALYAKAQFLSWYVLSPRYETYHDPDNATTALGDASGGPTLTSLTVTNIFDLQEGFQTRLEYRADKSDKIGSFKDASGNPTDNQTTYTLAFLMSF